MCVGQTVLIVTVGEAIRVMCVGQTVLIVRVGGAIRVICVGLYDDSHSRLGQ